VRRGLWFFLLISLTSTEWCAAEVSRAVVDAWIGMKVLADPPLPGTVINHADVDALAPWIPPGLLDEFRFPELRVEIQAPGDYRTHHSYETATEQFHGQATIGDDGSLTNYTAGQPFSNEQIAATTPDQAGLMVAWNQIHRWQYTGYKVEAVTMSYLVPGSSAVPLDEAHGLDGGGNLQRRLVEYYHRVYLSKLAWLNNQDYRFDVPDSDSRFFKDFISFLEPFDVKGTSFVVERYLDPHADDQVNIYSPTERRVRRFSARERADSFMGSEATMDDFDGFSGRVLDYQWTYLGRRALLYVADTQQEVVRGFGPHSRLPDDRWEVRDCHVVEIKSVLEDHPYGARVLFVDAQTWNGALSLIIDHDAKLWKTMQILYRAPAPQTADSPPETSVQSWRGQFMIDRMTQNSTIVQARSDTEHPHMKPSQIKRLFSVSSLTSGR